MEFEERPLRRQCRLFVGCVLILVAVLIATEDLQAEHEQAAGNHRHRHDRLRGPLELAAAAANARRDACSPISLAALLGTGECAESGASDDSEVTVAELAADFLGARRAARPSNASAAEKGQRDEPRPSAARTLAARTAEDDERRIEAVTAAFEPHAAHGDGFGGQRQRALEWRRSRLSSLGEHAPWLAWLAGSAPDAWAATGDGAGLLGRTLAGLQQSSRALAALVEWLGEGGKGTWSERPQRHEAAAQEADGERTEAEAEAAATAEAPLPESASATAAGPRPDWYAQQDSATDARLLKSGARQTAAASASAGAEAEAGAGVSRSPASALGARARLQAAAAADPPASQPGARAGGGSSRTAGPDGSRTADPDRLEAVRAAFFWAYDGYARYAFGCDELAPLLAAGSGGGLSGGVGAGAAGSSAGQGQPSQDGAPPLEPPEPRPGCRSAGFEMGVTLVDSLDGLLLLEGGRGYGLALGDGRGLACGPGGADAAAAAGAGAGDGAGGPGPRYRRARAWLGCNLRFDHQEGVSLFETTIRVLGGLLAAYQLSAPGPAPGLPPGPAGPAEPQGDPLLLRLALELGTRLLPAFGSGTGVPFGTVDLGSGRAYNPGWAQGASTTAEAGTLLLEFATLSRLSDDPRFAAAAERALSHLAAVRLPLEAAEGLLPQFVHPSSGLFTSSLLTLGARADSAYEYLFKAWLLRGPRSDSGPLRLFLKSVRAVSARLARVSSRGRSYVGAWDFRSGAFKHEMDAVACFYPGLLALAGTALGDSAQLAFGAELAETCVALSALTRSGLAPEIAELRPGGEQPDSARTGPQPAQAGPAGLGPTEPDFDVRPKAGASHNLLRPEVAESLFVLHRLTHRPQYRQQAWQLFQALEAHCRLPTGGYSGVLDVSGVRAEAEASPGLAQAQPGSHAASPDEAASASASESESPSESESGVEWEVSVAHNGRMDSFFLAETLKYLFLIFSDDGVLPLHEWVFNTEAHPLRLFPELPGPAHG